MTNSSQRRHMGDLMDLLVAHEPKIHYRQIRPMTTRTIGSKRTLLDRLASSSGITMDCSESVTLLCHLAGLKDPNGLHYDGQGFTGTLLEHLTHYHDPKAAKIGALCVFFGTGREAITGRHVAMVRHTGADPILFSHGDERGPVYRKLSFEKLGFHGYTFLSIAPLG